MILDCPACGAALVYDPETGKMKCESCSNLFETYELQEDFLRRGERELSRAANAFDTRSTSKTATESAVFTDIETNQTGSFGYTQDSNGSNIQADAMATHTFKQSAFNPNSSFDHPVYDHARSDNPELIDISKDDTMECNIYTCTSCGAEIVVNDLEVSTFCIYCGQPTVVFARIATMKKPRYIIPFSVTREKAISLIKENFDKGFFVPDDIKNVKPERIRGIYIPYLLFDIHYEDRDYLQGTVGSGKNARTYFYYRKAVCDFEKLALDGSKQLDDTTSRKLNPYYPSYMKDFSIEYLSGFYADQYDENIDKLKGQAIIRAQNIFENEIKRSVSASSVRILKKSPSFEITGTEYALYPAWFLTLRNEDKPYTLLINGQTEKVVGSVPYDKNKAVKYFFILGGMLSFILWTILYPMLLISKIAFATPFMWITFMTVIPIRIGIENMKAVKQSQKLSSLTETEKYVKNRQGD